MSQSCFYWDYVLSDFVIQLFRFAFVFCGKFLEISYQTFIYIYKYIYIFHHLVGAYIYGFSLLVSWKDLHKSSSIKSAFGMNCLPHKNPQCFQDGVHSFHIFYIFLHILRFFSVSFLIFPGDDAQIKRNEIWLLSRSSEKKLCLLWMTTWENILWILLHNFLHLNTRVVILKFCLIFAWSYSPV